MSGHDFWQFGSPMTAETAGKLEELCVRKWGRDRVRICVEIVPVAVVKTVDNEEDAKITIDNLLKAEVT